LPHYRIALSTLNSDQASSGSAPISTSRVRSLFSQPARVAGSDFLRREVAQRMFERLELIRLAPQRVLDAGCGEGSDLPVLQQHFEQARILGLDASPAMLGEAQAGQKSASSSMSRLFSRLLGRGGAQARPGMPDLICGDFSSLPLASASLGLVWSNLALHWHAHPDRVFEEWKRVLAVDGLLMFSCFGPDTFRQLRQAHHAESGVPQVLPFVDMHDLGDMLVHAGFATPVMDMEMLTLTYESADALLADVRALGGNPMSSRSPGLSPKAARTHLLESLELARNGEGRLELSVELVYGHAFRPQPKTTSSGEAIIRFSPRGA
jgi:malonyl-CoA O-methyltransferase